MLFRRAPCWRQTQGQAPTNSGPPPLKSFPPLLRRCSYFVLVSKCLCVCACGAPTNTGFLPLKSFPPLVKKVLSFFFFFGLKMSLVCARVWGTYELGPLLWRAFTTIVKKGCLHFCLWYVYLICLKVCIYIELPTFVKKCSHFFLGPQSQFVCVCVGVQAKIYITFYNPDLLEYSLVMFYHQENPISCFCFD
jgi:hypothetical protein